MSFRPFAACLLLAFALPSAAPASESGSATTPAAAPDARASAAYELEYRPIRDWTLFGGGLLVWGLTETALKGQLAPDDCHWCGLDDAGADDVNGFDRAGRNARWRLGRQHTAAKLSDFSAFVVLPLSLVGMNSYLAHGAGDVGTTRFDLLVIGQAVVVSGVVNQTAKFLVGRERPFVHALSAEEKALTEQPDDNNLSFYSGHTAYAFSLVVSTGMVASLRGYPNRWAIWAAGLPLAATVGYLRMAADRHYLSDVLVGAAIGTAIGITVPLLLHPRVEDSALSNVTLSPSLGGLSLSGTF